MLKQDLVMHAFLLLLLLILLLLFCNAPAYCNCDIVFSQAALGSVALSTVKEKDPEDLPDYYRFIEMSEDVRRNS